MLHHPCILGDPQQRGTKSEVAASPLPSQGPKRGRKCCITLAFSGVPNIGEQNHKWLPHPCLLGAYFLLTQLPWGGRLLAFVRDSPHPVEWAKRGGLGGGVAAEEGFCGGLASRRGGGGEWVNRGLVQFGIHTTAHGQGGVPCGQGGVPPIHAPARGQGGVPRRQGGVPPIHAAAHGQGGVPRGQGGVPPIHAAAPRQGGVPRGTRGMKTKNLGVFGATICMAGSY